MGIIISIICIIIIISSFLYYQFPYPKKPTHFDAMIILGYHCHDDGSLDDIAKKRMQCALLYHQQHPQAKIIVSGGSVQNQYNEALIMGQYGIDIGIDPNVIIYEKQARNTYENLLYSSQILDATHQVLVITSRFHIRRSAYFVRKFYPSFTMDYHPNESFHLKDAIMEYFRMWNTLYVEYQLKKVSKRD